MRLLLFYLILTLGLMSNVFGQAKTPNDTYQIGKKSSSSDKGIIFNTGDGASNKSLKIEKTSKLLKFDGNSFQMGDGVDVDKKWIMNIGAGSGNPFFKYDSSESALMFSNDGSLESKIGSGAGSGGAEISYLANTSFENIGTPVLNWTNSGGTFTQEDHVNIREGNEKFVRFIASGTGQYFESDLITIPSDVGGNGCHADLKYNQGDNVFKYQVLDQVDNVIGEGAVSDLTDFIKAPTIPFPCKSGDQRKLKIISTAAGTIDGDEAYLGPARGFVEGSGTNSLSARVQNNGAASILSQDDFVQSVTRSALGIVDVLFVTDFFSVIPAMDAVVSKISGTAEAMQLEIFNLSTSGFSAYVTNIGGSANDRDFSFTAHKQGVDKSQTQEAIVPEIANFAIESEINGISEALADRTGVFVTHSGASGVLTNIDGSSTIPCVGNPSTGTTCSAGNEIAGNVFNIPVSGKYEVCMNVSIRIVSMTNPLQVKLAITNETDDTIISDGTTRATAYTNSSSSVDTPMYLCEDFSLSQGKNTVKMFYSAIGTGTIFADSKFTFKITMKENFMARTQINNMVDTKALNGASKGVCHVLNNGTASFDTNDPDCWFLNSVNTVATGRVEIQAYSSGFKCTMNSFNTYGNVSFSTTANGEILTSSLPQTFRTFTVNDAGVAINTGHSLACSINK